MIPAAATIAPTATDPVELVGFEGYLRVERHLAASTIAANVARARRFLAGYAPPEGAVALTAAEVTRALLDEGVTRRPVSVKAFGYTLRALLRFFFITGVTSHDLSAATLVIRSPQPSRLPVGASRDEVAALLVSCDRDTSAGLRDHAVLLLLAHLGLRAIEVARLRLDDLDWRRGEILVRGKGNRDERLPLPDEVGEAIVAHQWLRDSFERVVRAIPPELAGKRDSAQIFHEVLDYRWYASQRHNYEVPLVDAVQGYIHDVLRGLPDEVLAGADTIPSEGRQNLLNAYDPSQGFDDDEDETPFDPWEASAAAPDTELLPDFLDIDALRRKAKGDAAAASE